MRKEGPYKVNNRIPVLLSAALFASAVLLSAAARFVTGFAQSYSVTVYPLLQGSIGRLAGLVPFSAGEMLCLALPAALIVYLIVLPARRRTLIHPIRTILSRFLLIAALLFFIYTACCGINYYRQPFVDRQAYSESAFTSDELAGFCEYAAEQIQASYADSPEAEYPEGLQLADSAVRAMKDLSGRDIPYCDCSGLAGFYPRPKELTFLSPLFSQMGVSGIYCPFTIEANINGEMTGLEKPFTACHELSHLKGFMNEGEANFTGWLACTGSDDPMFRRSGWLIAWIYAGSSLYAEDPERFFTIREKLPEEALRELEDNSKFWAERRTRAADVQDRVNDAYLKSNGQEHGIRTYGQLTTLMLMWYYSR